MNALRVASFSLPLSLLTLIGPAFTPQPALVAAAPRHLVPPVTPAHGAPKHAVPIPAALSFKITTRVGYKGGGEAPVPDQLIQATVWLRGDRARIETALGGSPSVVLFAPPYVYRLLPASKAGVSWRMDQNHGHAMGSFSPQDLLRDPTNIRTALTRGGATKQGSATLGGALCDVYVSQNFREPGTTAKAWLRHSDLLPVRLEVGGGSYHVAASWSDYQRPRGLAASLFEPPANYKIRMAQGQPPLSGM